MRLDTTNLPRRFGLFLVGIFLSGTGIALLVKANIGSSAVPYFSYVCTCICVGQFYRVMGRPARWLIWGSDRSGGRGEADPA